MYQNIKLYNINKIEKNIIVGSLLGDGSLSLYGRSKNAYYREQCCLMQLDYRKWKAEKLKYLDFKLLTNCKNPKLCSPSNQVYTDLYNKFYINGIKTITSKNILLLNHPIGLACLYMDDGSLVIDSSKRNNTSIYIFPRISLYTLCFSQNENKILKEHIKNTFNINFKLKKRKDGKNFILEINKKNEIIKFINTIKPFVSQIPCMHYKIDIEDRFNQKKNKLLSEGYTNVNTWTETLQYNNYSKYEESFIIQSKQNFISDKQIAKILNRTYYGTVDKIRRMRIEKKL